MSERPEPEAGEIAGRLQTLAIRLRQQGGYSVEAEQMIELAGEVATLAERVALLEHALIDDLPVLIQRVLSGAEPRQVNKPNAPLPPAPPAA